MLNRNSILLLLGAIALTGCGNRPATGKNKLADWQYGGGSNGQSSDGIGDDGDSDDLDEDPTLTPVLEKSIGKYGSAGTLNPLTVQTLNKLRIRFLPTANSVNNCIAGQMTPQGTCSQLSGARAYYNHLQVDICVGPNSTSCVGVTQNTNMVQVETEWSYELNFDDAIQQIPATGVTKCKFGLNGQNTCWIEPTNRNVTIRVKNARYDYNCAPGAECVIPSNIHWNGVLYIETDKTESLDTVFFQ